MINGLANLVLILILFASIASRAAEAGPAPGEVVGKIVLDVRDTLVRKVQAMKAEETNKSYYELMTGTSNFCIAAMKDTGQWSAWDSVVYRTAYGWFDPLRTLPAQSQENIPDAKPVAGRTFNPVQLLVNYISQSLGASRGAAIRTLYAAFETGDEEGFNRIFKSGHPRATSGHGFGQLINRIYSWINPFLVARIVFGASLLAAFILCYRMGTLLYKVGSGVLILTLFPHSFRVILDILVRGNPPSYMFHDPFIFVVWSGFLLGLVLELVQKDGIRLLFASTIGFAFLFIASTYGDRETIATITAFLSKYYRFAAHIMFPLVTYAGLTCLVFAGCVILMVSPASSLRKK